MRRLGSGILWLVLVFAAGLGYGADPTSGFKLGKLELRSIGPLGFGPDGILFVSDSYNAAVFAVDTGDTTPANDGTSLDIPEVNLKVAALLGTTRNQIIISDVAVNPISRNVYLSVNRGRDAWPRSTPLLVRVNTSGLMEVVNLDNIRFSKARLMDAPKNGDPSQSATITDVAYVEGKVYVAAMSNQEFSSNFRVIPFPFVESGKGSLVQIFHGSHGRWETRAPVRTFVPYKVNGELNIIAAYTCTPLVRIPVSTLKPNGKASGITIAEMGAGNRPIDMIVYQKNGQDYILMSNNSLGVTRMSAEGLDTYDPIVLATAVTGVPYEQLIQFDGIEHLQNFDAGHALIMQRTLDGALEMKTIELP